MKATTHESTSLYFIQGEQKISFSELYEAHWQKLCSIGNAITGDQQVTKDLVQDVFVNFLQKFEEREINNVSAYLMQSLRNECLRWLRDGKITDRHLAYMARAEAINTTEDHINEKFLSERISEVVESMPERPREIFKLSRFENLSNEEIAKRLNINQRTVENHLTRALQILRMSLKAILILWLK